VSYTLSLRSLVVYRQQNHENTEAISEKIGSAPQNFKLVGYDLSPETLIFKEKNDNSQLCKEGVEDLVEDKLIGGLLLESSNDKI